MKKIGSGAMGEVYKDHDLKDGRVIAVKVLSRDISTSDAAQRFKREFKLLAELHHPNLCAVYDFGTLKDGRSYYTMEYIDGKNIFEAAKGLPCDRIYPWVVQLCRVLEHVHAKGLIHFDVKPNNVLIQQIGSSSIVKLMDFGLADERQMKGGGLIKGTFPYIAPEVLKGLTVDHRADLYSLGILLYELFTKRLFHIKGEVSFMGFIKQSQKLLAVPPSKIMPNIPKKLEHLILKLISSEPSERINRANEVIVAVNKISRKKYALETEKTLEGYLMSSKLVGREREMNLLKSLFEDMRKGEGKVILITGEAGIGKSRLLNEFKVFVQLERSHCFSGAAHKDRTTVLELFHDVFSELINYLKEDRVLPRELKFSLAVLFRIFPALSMRRLKKRLPEVVPLEPNAEKLRIYEALSQLIRYLAAELGGIVILLDDLHWADDLTIQFLEYLGRNMEGRNILICGTARKDELEQSGVFRHPITNLCPETNIQLLELKPLDIKSLRSFLDSTITPESSSPELVRYLMEKSGGNPFYVEEIMRTLLRKRGISVGEKIATEDFTKISLPETVEGVVLKDLEDLDDCSMQVAKYAAVLLRDFDYDVMKRLTGLDDTGLSRTIWELRRKRILTERHNTYRFYHPTMREAISNSMSCPEKRDFYYQVGKTLEKMSKGRTDNVSEDLAYYFINAKDKKRGVRYGTIAAKKSSDKYANDQAIMFYKGTFNLLSVKDLKLRFDILLRLAEIESHIGYYDDSIRHYEKALQLRFGSLKKRISTYFGIGSVYEEKREYRKALGVYHGISRLLERMQHDSLRYLLRINIDTKLCLIYLQKGDRLRASRFVFDDLKFHEKQSRSKESIRLLASTYMNLAQIEYHYREYNIIDYDKNIRYHRKACKQYKKAGDEHRIPAVLNNLGNTYSHMFDFERALACYEETISIAEKTGDQINMLKGWGNIGNLLRDRGLYVEALDYYQKAIPIAKKMGHEYSIGMGFWGAGDCYFGLCDYDRSLLYFNDSMAIFDTLHWEVGKFYSTWAISKIHIKTGYYSSAMRFYSKALGLAEKLGFQRALAILLVDMSLIAIELGRFSEADKYINESVRIATSTEKEHAKLGYHACLCRINMVMKNQTEARKHCQQGMKMSKALRMEQHHLQFILMSSEINYNDKKYADSIRIANSAIRMAKTMGTKDSYIEAILLKVKNGIKLGILPTLEAVKILDEAKRIAEEIGNPELQRKVYFEYGRFLQENGDYPSAVTFYKECLRIINEISSRIKNKSYRTSYLNRPDIKEVFAAIEEIKSSTSKY